MKFLASLFSSILIVNTAHAAITIDGNFGTGFGALNAPSGSLVLFIVDTDSNGFLGASFSGDLLANADPDLQPQSNINVGGSFGGDTVLGRVSVTSGGVIPAIFTLDNLATYHNKNFALVWFNGLNSSATAAIAGTTYGIFRGADWVLPASNTGESFSTSATFANYNNVADVYARVTVSSGVATNDVFTTSAGPVFSIVPEPSTTLLGVIGALALLRRRRK